MISNQTCVCLLLVILLLGGCSKNDSRHQVAASGTVTFDGKPLEKGNIVFDPVDGKGGSVIGSIVDGQFTVLSEPGSKKVQISSTQESGKTSSDGEPIMIEMLPSKYSAQSNLKVELQTSQRNVFNFELTSN